MVERHTQQSTTILIVEDDPLIAMATAQKITQFGYEVVTAHTGEDAIRLATDHHNIGLILMDIDLGSGIDGTEAAQQILAVRHIPIIFLTAHTEAAYVGRVKKITRYGHVIKGSGDFVLKLSIEMAFELFREHEKTRRSEEKYRTLLETMHEGIWQIDRESYTTYVNPRMADILGYSVDEMMGKHLFEFMDDRGVERGKQLLDHRRTGIVEQHEFEFIRKNGDRIYALIDTTPIMDEDGNYDGALAALTDITERKQAEQALKESENKYRTLFEGAKDAIFLADGETGIILDVNPQAETLLGRSKEELVGIHQSELHPDSQEKQSRKSFNDDVERQEKTINKEFQVVHKDGRTIPVEISPSIIQIEGRQCVYGIFRDITERKQAEEALVKHQTILQNAEEISDVGSFELDIATGEFTLSDGWLRIHGCTKRKLTIEELMPIAHPEDRPKVEQAFDEALKHLTPYNLEHRIIRQNDSDVRIIRAKGKIECDDQGQPLKLYGAVQDITEQKQAEEALKNSLINLKLAQDIAKIGNWHFDPAIAVPVWSAKVYEIFNKTPEQGPPHTDEYKQIYGPEQFAVFNSVLQRAIKEGVPYDFILQLKLPGGIAKWVRAICRPDEKKGAAGYFLRGTIQDITELKQAEEALKESEAFLNETNKIARVGGWKYDIQNKKLIWTKELYHMHEVTSDFVPTVEKGWKFYPPDSGKVLQKAYDNTVANGKSYDLELEIITAKNNKKYVRVIGRPKKDIDGKVISIGGTFQDITEQKQAEEELKRYELITATVQDSMSFIDTNYIYQTVNDAYSQFANLPKEEIIGKTPAEVVGQKIFEEQIKPHLDICFSGENVQHQFWVNSPAKGRRFMDMHYYPLLAEDGSMLGAVIQGHDMTEFKALEDKLQEANNTKDKFFSIIAHDLRNPLIGLQSGVNLLVNHFQDSEDELVQYIPTELQKRTQYVYDLLDKLLTWARMQQGVIPCHPMTLDIAALVQNTVNLLHDQAYDKHIAVTCLLEDRPMVLADRNMVETIIRNLLSNAIKFTHEDGSITIKTHDAGEFLEIAISDDGVGMTARHQQKLFRVGENITREGTKDETGTGLGLILCKEFVEKHGGKIWVESEAETGSTFTFTLPKAK